MTAHLYYQSLKDEIIGTKIKRVYLKNEFGHFYYDRVGFFCPSNNTAPLARSILYGILKYHKLLKKDFSLDWDIDYLIHQAQ